MLQDGTSSFFPDFFFRDELHRPIRRYFGLIIDEARISPVMSYVTGAPSLLTSFYYKSKEAGASLV